MTIYVAVPFTCPPCAFGQGPRKIHATQDPFLFITMPTYYKKTNGEGVQVEDTRIAVVMVGLPARGKSLIAQKSMAAPPPYRAPSED